MPNIAGFIQGLPKAELHLHIEGSFEPELMFAIAARNGIALPYKDVEALRAAYRFSELQEFLDIYYQGMSVLQKRGDFTELTHAYLRRAAADNVRHAEIFFDPQGHTARGLAVGDVIEGIVAGLEQGRRDFGISSKLILCFLRHLSESDAEATLEQARPYLGHIAGIGLDSSEQGHPPEKFARVFAHARRLGLKLVAHAGEEGPPEYVWQALDILKVDRIDHGNRALEDAALVHRLAELKMPLTVCPLSNLKLCVVRDMAQHPLKKMLEAGLVATVNSDDPAYFGGYVAENFLSVAGALHLIPAEIAELARNSFRASFLDDAAKAKHLAEIDAYCAAYFD